MLNPGLPVFWSAAPTLVPVKVQSTWWWDETGKTLLSGHVPGFLVCAYKFICLHAFLFAYVCMRHVPRRSWASRAFRNDVCTLVQFYEDHTSPFLVMKYVTIEVVPVHCIVSDLLQANMHQHDSAFMWFRSLRWCFSRTKVTGDLRWALLDFLGRVTCDVWRCASQLHCSGSIASNHACTRLHIHAILCFKVTFSGILLFIPLWWWAFFDTLRDDVCDIWRCGSQLRCAGWFPPKKMVPNVILKPKLGNPKN